MDELIVHVSEKTYAYGAIRAENQNLLSTISELKTRLEKVESVLDNSKKPAKNVAVYVRKNKQTFFAAFLELSKTLCVTCESLLIGLLTLDVAFIPVEDKALLVLTFSTNSRPPKSLETTFVAPKTRFSKKETQSKTLDTTSVVSKSKIDVESASKAKDKVLDITSLALDNFVMGDLEVAFRSNTYLTWLTVYQSSNMELLHMDLCGPMRVASINGKKYILVIVDDFSRYTWVYFLCSKDETPEIIKKFIAPAQLNYKAKVCKIRTDNGTEFESTSLKAHYEKLGIMQQFSIARTPQQNGVVERHNRTLVEAARTMLIFSRLP
ncbi:retrovirus-related pol polyprotein from transposon TNT 1-94 [Tanacetum coccineum]|uniref:Retrovirus-related pol polyprotein from transposon TNT 1-94 n=1 Tax=Tanacetum coccineum TaxID=301880 RepID=A0ABQ5HUG4_9ASTR